MIRRPLIRLLLATAATAAVIALAGCNTEEYLTKSSLRAQQPLSPQMVAELDKKDMDKSSPILVRIFKEESELEVWKKNREGRYALLKTYPICRWSGELGPKIKEGDRQAPEGFYEITPAQMNPNSSYYLSFNTGFPNAYDRAWHHTGSDLMVHGDCSSRGCYAMTDEQIGEIYALARDSFFGGQRAFQLQAYPFRMTALNMARHRNNPNMPFWRMLKIGYDHFAVTHLEPKVDVCERHYVFDAEAPAGSTKIGFTPSGKCPVYQVPQDIAAAVAEKEQHDRTEVAELVERGTPTVPVRTGADGGMNRVFLTALVQHERVEEAHNDGQALAPTPTPVGTIPALVNPPHPTQAVYTVNASPSGGPVLASAAAAPAQPSSGGFFTSMGRALGWQDSQPAEPQQLVGAPKPAHAKPQVKIAHIEPKAISHVAKPAKLESQVATTSKPQSRVAAAKPASPPARIAHTPARIPELRGTTLASSMAKPSVMDSLMRPTAMAAPTRSIRGAQPVLPAGSFESRWSALR